MEILRNRDGVFYMYRIFMGGYLLCFVGDALPSSVIESLIRNLHRASYRFDSLLSIEPADLNEYWAGSYALTLN